MAKDISWAQEDPSAKRFPQSCSRHPLIASQAGKGLSVPPGLGVQTDTFTIMLAPTESKALLEQSKKGKPEVDEKSCSEISRVYLENRRARDSEQSDCLIGDTAYELTERAVGLQIPGTGETELLVLRNKIRLF